VFCSLSGVQLCVISGVFCWYAWRYVVQ